MSAPAVTPSFGLVQDVMREQMRTIHRILLLNCNGITQEESLIQPQPGGNCLNWNVGHLVWANENTLAVLGAAPVLRKESLQRYARGSEALRNPAEALPLEELLTAWDEQCARIDSALAALNADRLSEPAPYSPRKDPNETIGSLLSILIFHQASHTGQTSLLRRIAGKDGAIR